LDPGHENNGSAVPSIASNGDEQLLLFPGRLPTIREAEERVIQEAMTRAENNQSIAASLLGMSRRALNNRLRRKDAE
jgi:DNA-binding NtrC family response regulator